MMLRNTSNRENYTCLFFNKYFAIFNMGIFFNFMPRAGKQILYTDTTVWQIQQTIV